MLNFLSDTLREAGHEVLTAFDGWSALELVRAAQQMDLVITDYQMPGMNGLEFMAVLKEIRPALRVIMISVFARTDVYLKAISLDVAEFLEKPIKPMLLKRVVEAVTNKSAPDEAVL